MNRLASVAQSFRQQFNPHDLPEGAFQLWESLGHEIDLALTVNTSTHGNELEYNGLAATRMEELERRVLKLELMLSVQMEGKDD